MTVPPPLTPDEPLRLRALRAMNVVDTPIEERFERLTRMARDLLQADIVAISLVEADRQFFRSIQGLDVCGTERDVSFCGHTIVDDALHVVEDARHDPRFEQNPLVTGAPNIVTYAGMPIRSQDGHNIGAFCAINSTHRPFTPAQLQHLVDLATLAEQELQMASANAVQAALIEEANVERRRALIDPLTRLWNREGISEVATETLRETDNGRHGCALVMVDLDEFKPINDTHGHAVGDVVLRAVARRLLRSVREVDAVGRLGGDEFVCVLSPCDSESAAHDVCERIRKALCDRPVKCVVGQISVAASFGVCFVESAEQQTLEEALQVADAALYEGKAAGKNRVVVAGPERRAA